MPEEADRVQQDLDSLNDQLATFLTSHGKQLVLRNDGKLAIIQAVETVPDAALVNNPSGHDVLLRIGEHTIYGHKEKLALRSEYFTALWSTPLQVQSSDGTVRCDLPFPSIDEVLALFGFLYTGDEDKLCLNVENFIPHLQNSIYLGVQLPKILLQNCWQHNAKEISRSPAFGPETVPQELLLLTVPADRLQVFIPWAAKFTGPAQELQAVFSALQPPPPTMVSISKCRDEAGFSHIPADFVLRICEVRVKDLEDSLKQYYCDRCEQHVRHIDVRSGECYGMEHSGRYLCNDGWSCCGKLLKRSPGCKRTCKYGHDA
eukprot:TRINITY_DN61225_c0_g1_i1.p1 TRINITY_DN61225_c0_g1~~TRINITY_DN61225_c0_g1_i1.p1  ORF type:complete len:317 (-),score=21.02 TRINITY_DN61225_c0_g1_i1:193-1143(-)